MSDEKLPPLEPGTELLVLNREFVADDLRMRGHDARVEDWVDNTDESVARIAAALAKIRPGVKKEGYEI